ncbi:L,D-transpeptidase family protein [Clostridium sp. MB40-C1]|nr:L,D-transpeptidase family protein [Clostridium sp. MB40-C1]WMJ82398.1 L,D-transpeptidase family protein [Clostridium sp. MB40-C1]
MEVILIFTGYKKNNINTSFFKITDYNSKKPIVILINICDNTLNVLQDGNIIKAYTIASGKPSTPSPIGTWKIINKGSWGEGFGGRWMGLNVPWGKYGIHGTTRPNSIGWASSHGCIRMRNKDIESLYKITHIGTKVIIWGGNYGNFGSHLRTIKPGMRGSDIYEIQKILKGKGYYKATPDGIYGEYLKNTVHKFQRDNKLPISDTINHTFYKKLGIELTD